jgi:hypothetical protein
MHQLKQGLHYLHGALRTGEDTLVGLDHKGDSMLFPPLASIFGRESTQEPLHQSPSSWVDFLQVADALECVGQVAPSAARDGHLCQRALAPLVYDDISLRHKAFQLYCAKASCGSSSYDGYFHVAKVRNILQSTSRNS